MSTLVALLVSFTVAIAILTFRPDLWLLAIGLMIGEVVGFYLAFRLSTGPSSDVVGHQNAGLTELLRLRLFGSGERWIRQDAGKLNVSVAGLNLLVDATPFQEWEKDPEGVPCCSMEFTPSDVEARIVEVSSNPHNPLAKRITIYMPKDWVLPSSDRVKRPEPTV